MLTDSEAFYKKIESEISKYYTESVVISEGVKFSQYQTIKRIYKFKNNDLDGTKINPDLSYNFYFDMISPRADAEIKNLRFDTKHILLFSRNPIKDFAAVFVSNAKLKSWMADSGEDDKLKEAVEEFVTNGNIGFKRIQGGYEIVDPLNTIITRTTAKSINDTDIIERHEMSASELRRMSTWDRGVVEDIIDNCGENDFQVSSKASPESSTKKSYELFEFTGEVSEREFNAIQGLDTGDPTKYFLAKIIFAGLKSNHKGQKFVPYIQKLTGVMEDYYIYAHRGVYNGRFWRKGMYELLFDHQIRANEIGNDLARGLEWSSKVFFRTNDGSVMGNIRADMENGDIIKAQDLDQILVRMQGADQLIADWNRLMADADRLANSYEIVRGENLPSGTPFRLGALMDQNAGMIFVFLRQKLTLPFKRVFRNWVLPYLVKDLKGEEIFTLVGDTDILDQLRELMVEKWYMENLVKIGPHTREQAEAIKAEKLDELRETDPTIENAPEIWKGVLPRIFVTITGENSDLGDQVTDLINLLSLEQDPKRISWMLDQIYRIRNIPVPPSMEEQPAEQQIVSEASSPNVRPPSQVKNEAPLE